MVDFVRDYQGKPQDWEMGSIPGRINPTDAAEDRGYEARYGPNWLREDNGKEFGEWLAPKGINLEYVESAESAGLLIPIGGKFNVRGAGNAGTTMAYAYGQMNMRDVGKFSSREGSFKLYMREFTKSDLGGEIARIFAEQGSDFEKPSYIMVTPPGVPGIMGVGRLPSNLVEKFGPEAKEYEGKIVISVNYDFYQALEHIGKHFGAENIDMVFESLAEEFSHIYRKSLDKNPLFGKLKSRVEEERATKQQVVDALENLVGEARVPSERMRYEKVLHAKEDDVATVERYYKVYKKRESGGQHLEDMLDEAISGELSDCIPDDASDGFESHEGRDGDIHEYASPEDGYNAGDNPGEGAEGEAGGESASSGDSGGE